LTNGELAEVEEEYEAIISEQTSRVEEMLPKVPTTSIIQQEQEKRQTNKNAQKSKVAA